MNTQTVVPLSLRNRNQLQVAFIKSAIHRRITAHALCKNPQDVTRDELMEHWDVSGRRARFNTRYPIADLMSS